MLLFVREGLACKLPGNLEGQALAGAVFEASGCLSLGAACISAPVIGQKQVTRLLLRTRLVGGFGVVGCHGSSYATPAAVRSIHMSLSMEKISMLVR